MELRRGEERRASTRAGEVVQARHSMQKDACLRLHQPSEHCRRTGEMSEESGGEETHGSRPEGGGSGVVASERRAAVSQTAEASGQELETHF